MASILDIPVELIEPIARVAFKNWLLAQPIDASTRRRLIKLWRRATKATWTKEDYAEMQVLEIDEPI